jgi:ATPase subunit of ABC transporter with duplicated ATPase domains
VVELCRGSLISYCGNYEYYKEKSARIKNALIDEKVAEDNSKARVRKEKIPETINNNGNKQNLEKRIEALEEKLKSVESEIAEYGHNYEKLAELFNEKLELQTGIEKLMVEYFN